MAPRLVSQTLPFTWLRIKKVPALRACLRSVAATMVPDTLLFGRIPIGHTGAYAESRIVRHA
jgi:hypothetical protein